MSERELVVVRVEDKVNQSLTGHDGCRYESPPQPPEQALTLARVLLGYSREKLDVGDRWACPIAGGRRTVALKQWPIQVAEGDYMTAMATVPVVELVLRFEDLPPGSMASRRAVVRWSDGSEGEALRWYADEVLVCEGDLIGKTQDELRSVHFRRDRDWLQS